MTPAQRRLAACSVLAFQVLCTVALGLLAARLPYDNRIDRFAVEGRDAERRFEIFRQAFGVREYFLVVLEFRGNALVQAPATGERLFRQVAALNGIQGYFSLATLVPDGTPDPDIPTPFPFLDKEHGLYTGIFEIGNAPERDRTIAEVLAIANSMLAENTGILKSLLVAGEPIVNHQLNLSSIELKTRFFPLLIVCSLILLSLLFRSLKILLVTACSVVSSLATTLGFMALSGLSLNLVTALIPALVFVLSVAMQVHVLNSMSAKRSILDGLRAKLRANLLISLTTSIGFASLTTSQVAPIVTMGKFMALGIWVIFAWTHLTHLGLSVLLKLQPVHPSLHLFDHMGEWSPYLRLIRRRVFLAIPLAAIACGTWFLTVNPKESNALMYFQSSHPIRVQTDMLQKKVTGASHMELLIRGQGVDGREAKPDWARLQNLETTLLELPHVRHVMSLNQIAGYAGKLMSVFAGSATPLPPDAVLTILRQASPKALQPFLAPDYYRIQILVDSLDRDQYLTLKAGLGQAMDDSGFGDRYLVTGTLDRVIEIQGYLLRSLSLSLGITVGTVVLVLLLLMRRSKSLAAILIPNLFPLGCMAITMWALQIKTTISSVMVFSIAFGIAVDGTIHLLDAYARYAKCDVCRAWQATLAHDARAVVLTTLVLTMGFLVFTVSSFIPTRDFGLLLGSGMVFSLFGNLFFLPMLLCERSVKDRSYQTPKKNRPLAGP